MQHGYQIDHDEAQKRWYVVDSKGNLLGNLSGFKSECEALNWIEADKIAPRHKCPQCKRIWKGSVTKCAVCDDVRAVFMRMVETREGGAA